ncbi:hypothetical protein BQ8794_220022 [Mesorhizobium prunaredense]|uniref:Uncharacterized protein n=1 Tax=Mesorhizobium prunaredense TaxID=1631249 RepID=A0A1R3V6G0_9HYPH|nr:hypothetical protein BQ8794_220022 [Mesorhizobium prunaredense]
MGISLSRPPPIIRLNALKKSKHPRGVRVIGGSPDANAKGSRKSAIGWDREIHVLTCERLFL